MASSSSHSYQRSQSQLQQVRSIAQRREQKLASEVGELMRQRDSAEATVERLQGYLHEYQSDELERGARSLMAIENERRFVNRLSLALNQQSTYAQRLEESTCAKMKLWQHEHANLQALDRLIAQRSREQLRLQERRDQQQSDALSLRAHNKGVFS